MILWEEMERVRDFVYILAGVYLCCAVSGHGMGGLEKTCHSRLAFGGCSIQSGGVGGSSK